MRHLRSLPGIISSSIVGLLVGHQLAYAFVFRDPRVLAHALADTGHTWLALLPIFGGLALAISLVQTINTRDDSSSFRHRAAALIVVQLVAYVAIEIVERLAHGALPSDLFAEIASRQGALLFFVGLLMQVATALGVVLLSRGIASAARYLLRAARLAVCQRVERLLPASDPRRSVRALLLQPVRGPPLLA
jgi:hypothetical protein